MKKLLFITALILCSTMIVSAQESSKPQMNFVKFNLTSLLLKNYSFQYERVLSKHISAAVGFRFMPYTTLPFKSSVIKMAKIDDPQIIDMINTAEFANYSITPEIRFYLGKKGYGRGFYIAPYYRYAAYEAQKFTASFEVGDQGQPGSYTQKIDFAGSISSHTGGIMLGVQWALGKHFSFDWWILGAAYGASNGTFSGKPTPNIPEDKVAQIKEKLEEMNIPNKTIEVTPSNVKIGLDGIPWAGLRSGIIIGVKF